MKTFFGLLGEALPTSGARLSVLAFELPAAITPTVAGLAVGAFVGVFGFIAVLLIIGRGSRRGTDHRARMPAHQVVFVPPYATTTRETPLPPAAFQLPPSQPYAYAHQHAQQTYTHAQRAPQRSLAFVPSTDLSARAFAKMGYAVDAEDGHYSQDSPTADPELMVEIDFLEEDDDEIPAKTYAPLSAPVSVAKIVMVEEDSGVRPAAKSDPRPLGIIKSDSVAMKAPRPASFADLELDDGATEIGETYFDEPPQPRRRTDPPKIRAVAPSGPRFPAQQPLPQITPPPPRAVPSARAVRG